MSESTQMGDDRGMSVDDAAALLMERRKDTELPPVEAAEDAEFEEVTEETEEQDVEEQIDADEEADEALTFEYVEEVAEAAGMSPEEFLTNIKARTKIDGEEGEVALADLLKGHQLESSFTRKNQQWIEQKTAEEAKIQEERKQLHDHLNKAAVTFDLAQKQLTSDFQSIDWNKLQADDPQQFLLKRQQFGERKAALDAAIQQAAQQYQTVQEEQEKERAELEERRLNEEHGKLLKSVPEWNDEQTRIKQAAEVSDYLRRVGFSDDEISTLGDHRIVVLARAALGQGVDQKKLKLAEKKVKEVSRLARPGSQKPRGSGAQKAAQEATAKAKKTGKTDDVAAALVARRKARAAERARATRRAPQ